MKKMILGCGAPVASDMSRLMGAAATRKAKETRNVSGIVQLYDTMRNVTKDEYEAWVSCVWDAVSAEDHKRMYESIPTRTTYEQAMEMLKKKNLVVEGQGNDYNEALKDAIMQCAITYVRTIIADSITPFAPIPYDEKTGYQQSLLKPKRIDLNPWKGLYSARGKLPDLSKHEQSLFSYCFETDAQIHCPSIILYRSKGLAADYKVDGAYHTKAEYDEMFLTKEERENPREAALKCAPALVGQVVSTVAALYLRGLVELNKEINRAPANIRTIEDLASRNFGK